MRQVIFAALAAMALLPAAPRQARAYDIDCAIMLCMAGGFPPSAVCARAYRVMIQRITPWPSRPPFGICTYANVPAALGGSGGEAALDISTPEYEWLNRTHVIWFYGRSYEPRDEFRQWDWSVKSCDGENRTCRHIVRVHGSPSPWPGSFTTENGQVVLFPGRGGFGNHSRRAIMIEYGDYEGVVDHSEWFSY